VFSFGCLCDLCRTDRVKTTEDVQDGSAAKKGWDEVSAAFKESQVTIDAPQKRRHWYEDCVSLQTSRRTSHGKCATRRSGSGRAKMR